jgi:pimeloyl-ACP methyl ester carboxylesterase
MYAEQTLTLNDKIEINYMHTNSSGRPIVLLHGATSAWQSFLPLIPMLTREFQVYAMDLRGHGRSSWVTDGYQLSEYAKDIHCFLGEKIMGPTVLYGHSLGALIAILVAAQSPERVHRLILGDPPFYHHNTSTRESVWYEPFVELHHVISAHHSAQEIEDYIAEHYPSMDPERRKARAETLSHVDPNVVAAILDDRLVEGYDTDALLRQITCPVLLIAGNPALGSALRPEDATYMLERLHSCDILRMQDVGHGLPVGDALSRVEDFLRMV